ncbi:hypothetical protein QR680_014905 [Steinernema hermaphroditum]|uniref:Uncharacterized protein n=1 Tax=Steinernema hermaphroditum TaxID=289476 RepID=A0AA39M4T9_9BILA|nr:hypothetical protein QR680_014905 [Steinernema hermaphroditum]
MAFGLHERQQLDVSANLDRAHQTLLPAGTVVVRLRVQLGLPEVLVAVDVVDQFFAAELLGVARGLPISEGGVIEVQEPRVGEAEQQEKEKGASEQRT